jgi:hypothetical protein
MEATCHVGSCLAGTVRGFPGPGLPLQHEGLSHGGHLPLRRLLALLEPRGALTLTKRGARLYSPEDPSS